MTLHHVMVNKVSGTTSIKSNQEHKGKPCSLWFFYVQYTIPGLCVHPKNPAIMVFKCLALRIFSPKFEPCQNRIAQDDIQALDLGSVCLKLYQSTVEWLSSNRSIEVRLNQYMDLNYKLVQFQMQTGMQTKLASTTFVRWHHCLFYFNQALDQNWYWSKTSINTWLDPT